MILEKQTQSVIQQEGETQDSIGMSLDLDSAQVLMQMLSKNLYSDDIGSAIRECASNALDSHRRAGVDTTIIVSFKASAASNYEFCVEDFGIGLDADDVRDIISKYGKSTKRESTTELGMMGLGFKAGNGRFLRSWGEGLFTAPHVLRTELHDNLWATDRGSHQVFKFSAEGKLLYWGT